MKLKWIRIKGFKAYKDETTVYLHPGANAIVGTNGSGKSTLLEAVTLVVSEVYGRRIIDQKSVFHSGVRNHVLKASIELSFDNTDRKLTMYDRDDVILCRTFLAENTNKRDQFSVAGKKVTKQEFAGVLEAGGFSKGNPYYVVRQGKIMEMAMMTDEGRLKLLKDFSGVQIYEEKREQAIETLNSAQEKARDSDVIVANLERRLADLQEQQKEVLEYEEMIRTTEVYRAVIVDLESVKLKDRIVDLKAKLDELTRERDRISFQHDTNLSQLESLKLTLNSAKDAVDAKQKAYDILADQVAQADSEEMALENECRKFETGASHRQKELERLDHLKRKNEKLLDEERVEMGRSLESRLKEAECHFTATEEELKRVLSRRVELNEKLERCKKFKTVKERNKSLLKTVKDVQNELQAGEQNLFAVQQEEVEHSDRVRQLEEELKKLRSVTTTEDELVVKQKVEQLRIRRNDISNEKSRLNEEKMKLSDSQALYQQKKDHLEALRQNSKITAWRGTVAALQSVMPHGVRRNEIDTLQWLMTSIQKWISTNVDLDVCQQSPESTNMPPVFGPLWALMQVDEDLQIACAQAMGPQMDNLIVWNDEVAVRLYPEIKRAQAALTITPLNQLILKWGKEGRSVKYPPGVKNIGIVPSEKLTFKDYEAVPLLTVIECPKFVRPAISSIAARWLIAKNIDAAHRISQTSDFDCVTLQGDKVTSKGSVQGGFLTISSNQLANAARFHQDCALESTWKGQIDAINDRLVLLTEEEQSLVRQLRNLSNDFNDLNTKEALRGSEIAKILRLLDIERNALYVCQKDIRQQEQRLANCRAKLVELKQILSSQTLEGENPKNDHDLQVLNETQEGVENAHKKAKALLADRQREYDFFVKETEQTKSRLQQLKQEVQALQSLTSSSNNEAVKQSLESVKARKKQITAQKRKVEKEMMELRDRLEKEKAAERSAKEGCSNLKEKLDDIYLELETIERRIRESTLQLEKNETERETIFLNAGQTADTIEKLKKMPLHRLRKLYDEAETKLTEAPRVNQRALDELMSFQEELKKTINRRQQLLDSFQSVKDLMAALDERRSKTLRHAFDQVNSNLQEIFGKVVNGGRAKLVIKKMPHEKVAELRKNLQVTSSENAFNVENTPSEGPSGASQAWKLDVEPDLSRNTYTSWDEVACGIEIKASFRSHSINEHGTENAEIEYFPLVALSGGQKTILALSLILAMQKCDKAPFYLLDEADAALDEAYRAAVARVVKESSTESQFLITTFRKELCAMSDKHFHVTNVDRAAIITEVDRETALNVIMQEDSAPKAITASTPASIVTPMAIGH